MPFSETLQLKSGRLPLPQYLPDATLGQVRALDACSLYLGQVRVTNQVIGYERRHLYDSSVLGREPLDLPPTTFETQALWFDVPPAIQHAVMAEGLDVPGGLHAVEHACIALFPLLAMCDRNDIGGLSRA